MLLLVSMLLLTGCDAPDPCQDMCVAAVQVQCDCLEDWGVEWSDVGYRNQEDYLGTCETWAWEMRILERDARQHGEIETLGHVDKTCTARTKKLRDEDLSCTEWSDIDWSERPWER